jgi:hypothetical protein
VPCFYVISNILTTVQLRGNFTLPKQIYEGAIFYFAFYIYKCTVLKVQLRLYMGHRDHGEFLFVRDGSGRTSFTRVSHF